MKRIILSVGLMLFGLSVCDTQANPLSYDIYDEVKNQSVGTRPFFVGETTGSCSVTEVERRICSGAIAKALRKQKYRVTSAKKTVQDYNIIQCNVDMAVEQKARTTKTVDLFGSIKKEKLKVDDGFEVGMEISLTTSCDVYDAFTEDYIYSGVGEATGFIREKSKINTEFSRAVTDSVRDAIGKMGKAKKSKTDNLVYLEATGYDDGTRSTSARDLKEAIDSAKVLIVEKAGTRIQTESGGSFSYSLSQSGEEYSEKDNKSTNILSDARIVEFDILEDFGYVDGRYKVKIGAKVALN